MPHERLSLRQVHLPAKRGRVGGKVCVQASIGALLRTFAASTRYALPQRADARCCRRHTTHAHMFAQHRAAAALHLRPHSPVAVEHRGRATPRL